MNKLNQKIAWVLLFFWGAFGVKIAAQSCVGSGVLTVTVQDCSSTFSPERSVVRIYPNPAQAEFWVKNEGNLLFLEVFDALGRKVLTENIPAETTLKIAPTIPLNGVYWVRWSTGISRGSTILVAGIQQE